MYSNKKFKILIFLFISLINIKTYSGAFLNQPINFGLKPAQISAGSGHTCAITNGYLQCWGFNSSGQLGDGHSPYDRSLPYNSTLRSFNGATLVKAVHESTCSIINSKLYCWGDGNYGQLGLGEYYIYPSSPRQVTSAGTDVRDFSIGRYHVCAVKTSGEVWCSGWKHDGPIGTIGNAGTNYSFIFEKVNFSGTAISVASGVNFSCVLSNYESGNVSIHVYCWGLNEKGQLGIASVTSQPNSPVVLPLTPIAISAGYLHACAIVSNGNVYCWGVNHEGEAGINTIDDFNYQPRIVQKLVDLGVSAIAISAGEYHTCILSSAKKMYCWGLNVYGQVGKAAIVGTPSPSDAWNSNIVATPFELPFENVTEIAVGGHHTCAVISGVMRCWGANDYGQIGDKNIGNGNTSFKSNWVKLGP